MTEQRFELLEKGKTCWDNKDLKCLDECKEAAYELGYRFYGPWNSTTESSQNISKGCHMRLWDEHVVLWVVYGAGEEEDRGQAICRKNGKSIHQYCIE